MYEELVATFNAAVAGIGNLEEPVTKEQLAAQLSRISEAMNKCEKLLIYLATSVEHHDDLATFLFQFKQLARLEQTVTKRMSELPAAHPATKKEVPRWQFWRR